jgi:hypothetical protein
VCGNHTQTKGGANRGGKLDELIRTLELSNRGGGGAQGLMLNSPNERKKLMRLSLPFASSLVVNIPCVRSHAYVMRASKSDVQRDR